MVSLLCFLGSFIDDSSGDDDDKDVEFQSTLSLDTEGYNTDTKTYMDTAPPAVRSSTRHPEQGMSPISTAPIN